MTLPRRPSRKARQYRALRRLRMWVALRLREQRRKHALRPGRGRGAGPAQPGGDYPET
ncbi:MAG TPA: hypothetical protein VNT26_22495 [Candidatus Sulfotelmatobacter sp.]|nr:hypothetical protein [Candidatus Sulfotelmatobacter sp.]